MGAGSSALVWYAYRQFGLDLDGNGGALVLPFDLANSSQMELVQVFGSTRTGCGTDCFTEQAENKKERSAFRGTFFAFTYPYAGAQI